jgi:hypothetical protein
MSSAAAVFTVWLLWTGSYALVAVIGLAWLAIAVRRRARIIARRDAGLRARAEYEHRLSLTGDPRGIYGRYPPVQPGWFPGSAKPLPVALFRRRVVDRLYGFHGAVMPSVVAVPDRRQVARRRLHQRSV